MLANSDLFPQRIFYLDNLQQWVTKLDRQRRYLQSGARLLIDLIKPSQSIILCWLFLYWFDVLLLRSYFVQRFIVIFSMLEMLNISIAISKTSARVRLYTLTMIEFHFYFIIYNESQKKNYNQWFWFINWFYCFLVICFAVRNCNRHFVLLFYVQLQQIHFVLVFYMCFGRLYVSIDC